MTDIVNHKKQDFRFFQNRDCEYFPCHKTLEPDEFNCHFCYCPLYTLDDKCGGDFSYTSGGVKDCTFCLRPHSMDAYDDIILKVSDIIDDMAAKHRKKQ